MDWYIACRNQFSLYKNELWMQATRTRFSLIYSAVRRYRAF